MIPSGQFFRILSRSSDFFRISVLQPHLLGDVLGYFHDAADRPIGLPDRIRRKPDRSGFPFFTLVDVQALGSASRIRRQADRALLAGIAARPIVPVCHLVATLFPAFFQWRCRTSQGRTGSHGESRNFPRPRQRCSRGCCRRPVREIRSLSSCPTFPQTCRYPGPVLNGLFGNIRNKLHLPFPVSPGIPPHGKECPRRMMFA